MYNELYKAWKAEKTIQTPQPLQADFYRRMAGYLKNLEEDATSSDPHTIQGRLLLKEKEMATRLLKELKESRLQKIMNAAKNGETVSATELTDEEKNLINGVNQSLASFNEKRSEKEEPVPSPGERPELKVIRFLQDIPEIIGVDLKMYGPYKKEDVGSLPSQNAHALIKQGVAKPIEVRAANITAPVST